jgi:hypothetical protein
MTITNANEIKTGDKITVAKDTSIVSIVTKIENGEIFVDYNGQDNHIPVGTLQAHIDCGMFIVTRKEA